MSKPWIKTRVDVTYDMNDVFSILKSSENAKEYEIRKVAISVVDTFLYSGRFNSVLGQDGFGIFKDRLKEVLKKVNDNDFGANYVNLDKMYEALLASGVYYLDEYLPKDINFLKTDQRWLTAYRYVARNFPDISYQDFREVVKRFQETSGHSIYIAKDDSETLRQVATVAGLFNEVIDLKAALLQLSQKQLRSIGEQLGVPGARSNEETASRIVEATGDKALALIPEGFRSRKSLLIKDTELATGPDIINLDSYLRAIAKVVRQDLVSFIDQRRNWSLLSPGEAA